LHAFSCKLVVLFGKSDLCYTREGDEKRSQARFGGIVLGSNRDTQCDTLML
jgi:hypothetical protein